MTFALTLQLGPGHQRQGTIWHRQTASKQLFRLARHTVLTILASGRGWQNPKRGVHAAAPGA